MPEPYPTASADLEREIFLAALDRAPGRERAEYLERTCGNDLAMRSAVEALLANHKPDNFLETPVIEPPAGAGAGRGPSGTVVLGALPEVPGDWIGHYKLLQ